MSFGRREVAGRAIELRQIYNVVYNINCIQIAFKLYEQCDDVRGADFASPVQWGKADLCFCPECRVHNPCKTPWLGLAGATWKFAPDPLV